MRTHKEELADFSSRVEEQEAETTRLRAEAATLHAYASCLEDERDEATRELAGVRRTLDEYRVAHIHSLETAEERQAGVNEHAHVEGDG